MKWRSSLVYLLLLVLVGGYFFYFEVYQKERQEKAAKEARKVFQFQTANVNELSVTLKGQSAVDLKKGEQWQLVAPLQTDADQFSVQDLLGALAKLESEREVVAAPGDLKPFGLLEPSLTIRFQASGQEMTLLIGDKNPVGDGSYAKIADKPQVFLIAEGNRSALTRGLNELRRRQLFTFQLDEVVGVKVAWQDGNATSLILAADKKEWKAPDGPEMKIKKNKVDNLVEQIHWMRAQEFLEEGAQNLSAYGLAPPWVTVTLDRKSGETIQLKLAQKDKDNKAAALSSQLPAVVQVAANILEDLPKHLQSLQDRSLLGLELEDIQGISWQLDSSQGQLVQAGADQWEIRKGDQPPETLKEPWMVRSLLWDLVDAEYQQKLDPAPPVHEKTAVKIELRQAGQDGPITLKWEKPPEEGKSPVPVWQEKAGETSAVAVDAETLRRIGGDFDRLGEAERKSQ